MGYLNHNGPDDPEMVLLHSRGFVVALGHLLKEREGIVVEIKPENKKYVVYLKNKQIFMEEMLVSDFDSDEDFSNIKNGQMIWMDK